MCALYIMPTFVDYTIQCMRFVDLWWHSSMTVVISWYTRSHIMGQGCVWEVVCHRTAIGSVGLCNLVLLRRCSMHVL